MSSTIDHTKSVYDICSEHFDLVGIASAEIGNLIENYKDWLSKGYHGEMNYLQRHLPFKEQPQLILPKAKSWISLGQIYDTNEELSTNINFQPTDGWVSRYARSEDYHENITKKLTNLCYTLKQKFQQNEFVGSVDFKPVFEREIAYRAGLGWIGKNTCLINKQKGSFFFLAEILTDLELTSSSPSTDHCGTCNKCIDACPTNAIIEPRLLDATKCISYWTIEAKSPPPPELEAKFGNHLFGCDICQDVCPWNISARKKNSLPDSKESGIWDLTELVKMTEDQIKSKISNSAMSRVKPNKLMLRAQEILKKST